MGDKKDEAAWKKYKKKNKCGKFKKYANCEKDTDPKGCKKEKKSFDMLVDGYAQLEKYWVKPLEKLENGLKDGVFDEKNLKDERRLQMEENDGEEIRRLQAVVSNNSLQKLNTPPSNASMFVKPNDLHHLKKYVSDGISNMGFHSSSDGPNAKERRLFKAFKNADKEKLEELKKGMTKNEMKDFERKLKMSKTFSSANDYDDDTNISNVNTTAG